jgi:hypothetical protein
MLCLFTVAQLITAARNCARGFLTTCQGYMATKSPTNSAELRRLYSAHKAGNRHATQSLASMVPRVKTRGTKATPKRTAHRVVTPRAAVRPPIDKDDGRRLVAAAQLFTESHRTAYKVVTALGNATAAENDFLAIVRQLPPRAPGANHTLREWRHFTKVVEDHADKLAAAKAKLPKELR